MKYLILLRWEGRVRGLVDLIESLYEERRKEKITTIDMKNKGIRRCSYHFSSKLSEIKRSNLT
jgi:hypothetical protein